MTLDQRVPEPELMEEPEQARAYSEADFAAQDRPMGERVYDKFVESEADMHGRIGRKQSIVTPEANEFDPTIDVGANLLLEQLPNMGAAPARIRNKVLRSRQREHAAPEFLNVGFERIGMLRCLGGDALDDGEQVLRPVAHLPQQLL